MSDDTGPHGISRHTAVRLEQCIIMFGGDHGRNGLASTHIIWMYNLYTEIWKKYEIPNTSEAPRKFFAGMSAVVIGSDVYMFDGRKMLSQNSDDTLWKLTRILKGNICWNRIISATGSATMPSYRYYHSGWEYEGKMWIFGGYITGNRQGYIGYCNELLCFNPSRFEWTEPKCFGSVPTPRRKHATTQVKDKVILFGGTNSSLSLVDDLFELDMKSFIWTEIQLLCQDPKQGV